MNKFVLIIITLAFLAAGCNKVVEQKQTKNVMTVGGAKLSVELAKTDAEQRLGLGKRDSLPENSGMVFIFVLPHKPSFWMKDMKFALDFIWISYGKIVAITPNVQAEPNVPDSVLKLYSPAVSVDQVLEVNAGWAAKNGIKVGDEARLTVE